MNEEAEIVVREFDAESDRGAASDVDRTCEVGPSGKMALYTDLLGDPVSRVRRSPAFLLLVAETVIGSEKEIVGLIRGCVKTVTCANKTSRGGGAAPIFTKVGYILGLRVSPSHRRVGIGSKLVEKMEEWFRGKGAEYAYMATDADNAASVRLFIDRCGYSKFRNPAILVQPVFAHRLSLPRRRGALIRLSPSEAELLYRRRFSTVEFFPRDIDAVLNNALTVGTYLAVPEDYELPAGGVEELLADPPPSWAVASVWDCKSVFRMEVRGASAVRKGLAWASRAADRALPWLRIPSVPDIFRPFGLYFMYGVGGEGPGAAALVRVLCRHAHNLARDGGCGVLAAEVAGTDPVKEGIPHWRRLSCEEDLWCVKRLNEEYSDGAVGDWTKSRPGPAIFVDPREF